jgi:hypothetical protein
MTLLILSIIIATHMVQLSEKINYLNYPLLKIVIHLDNPDKDKFFEIKYEELLKQKNICHLSQIATDVQYIQLETNEHCLISELAKYYFSDSLIFVADKDHVLEFSINGKFIRQIGKPGNGPGEISSIIMMSVLPKQRMIVLHDHIKSKMIYYSFNGNFIKTVTVPRHKYIKVLNNGMYISYEEALGKSEENYFSLTNESGKIISAAKNYNQWSSRSGQPAIILNWFFEPFYLYQKNTFFKTMFNDTVYTINENKIIPRYFINLGKSKLPEEKRPERINNQQSGVFRENSSDYYWATVFEAGEKIFLKTIPLGDGSTNYFLINKKDFINNTNPSYNGTSKGFILNDWDGGIFFWPDGNLNDNQVFMPLDIMQLKKYHKTVRTQNITVKHPDKRQIWENILSKAYETSNPILMVVTLKP